MENGSWNKKHLVWIFMIIWLGFSLCLTFSSYRYQRLQIPLVTVALEIHQIVCFFQLLQLWFSVIILGPYFLDVNHSWGEAFYNFMTYLLCFSEWRLCSWPLLLLLSCFSSLAETDKCSWRWGNVIFLNGISVWVKSFFPRE